MRSRLLLAQSIVFVAGCDRLLNLTEVSYDLDAGSGDGEVPACAGMFGERVDHLVGAAPYSVQVGDLNSDGLGDLVVANDNADSISVLLGATERLFVTKLDHALTSNSNPRSLAIAHLDNDTVLDVAVALYTTGKLVVLHGTGDGTFSTLPSEYDTGSNPYWVHAADVGGDARPDLVVPGYINGSVSVFVFDPTGNVIAMPTFSAGAGPLAVDSGDLNGDGARDMVVANYNGNSVTVASGPPSGNVYATVSVPTGAGPNAIVLADVAADTNLDIVTTSYADGAVNIIANDGNGGFTALPKIQVSARTYMLAAADLDLDGDTDLVVTNSLADTVSVLFAISKGQFATPVNYPVGVAPFGVAVSDFDGDGLPDIVVANRMANTVTTLFNCPR